MVETRRDLPLSRDIRQIEKVVVNLLRRERGFRARVGRERLRRLEVDPFRLDLDELLFRPAKCRQPSSEDAAGVDVDGSVQPVRFDDGGVTVGHRRAPPILGGPIRPNRKAVLIGLTGRLAVERELPNAARARPWYASFRPAWATTSRPPSST